MFPVFGEATAPSDPCKGALDDPSARQDAAMVIGYSARHYLRLRSRYDEDGLDGLPDRRVGRVSRHWAACAVVETITRLYRERYEGFNMRHFHDLARQYPV